MRVIGIWLITAVAIAVAVSLVPGVEFVGANVWVSLAVFAALLALLNAFIKPVLQIISLPITVLTLGIFALIVNTAVLYLAAWISNGLFGTAFIISNFGSALLASIIISIVTIILNALTGIKDPLRNINGTLSG
ncbi:MAG: phage holin family protein [Coriobacteriales bacterium]|jgi:putative membrane protein|nr:phage holin family protein [Coriobacteriales bacterium]